MLRKNSKGRLLGVDISSSLGWAAFDIVEGKEILVAVGVTKTLRESKQRNILVSFDDIRRGMELANALRLAIEKYDVRSIVVEVPTGSQSAQAAKALGIAKGIIASVATLLPVLVDYLTPADLKRTATGRVSTTKEEIWNYVRRRYSYFDGWPRKSNGELPPVNGTLEHIADACLCVATAVDRQAEAVAHVNQKAEEVVL